PDMDAAIQQCGILDASEGGKFRQSQIHLRSCAARFVILDSKAEVRIEIRWIEQPKICCLRIGVGDHGRRGDLLSFCQADACRLAALDNDRLDFRTCSNLRTNRSCCFSNGLGERSETALDEKCGRYWAAADCGLEQQRSARSSRPRAGKGSNNPARG